MDNIQQIQISSRGKKVFGLLLWSPVLLITVLLGIFFVQKGMGQYLLFLSVLPLPFTAKLYSLLYNKHLKKLFSDLARMFLIKKILHAFLFLGINFIIFYLLMAFFVVSSL